jgi:hypothetical protein
MLHELWEEPGDSPFLFVQAGPGGDAARAMLPEDARLTWTVEAASYFEAMTKYYEHQGWGEWTTDFPQFDKQPYAERGEE